MTRFVPAIVAASLALAACGERPPPAPEPPAAPRKAARPAPGSPACADPGAGPEPDARALKGFLQRRAKELRACYDRALKRNDASGGKVTVRFTIGTCGEIASASVVARAGRAEEAGACVARAMRAWRTPFRPSAPVEIDFPIDFMAPM